MIKKIVDTIIDPNHRTMIGVCSIGIFRGTKCTDVIDFGYIHDSYMEVTAFEK